MIPTSQFDFSSIPFYFQVVRVTRILAEYETIRIIFFNPDKTRTGWKIARGWSIERWAAVEVKIHCVTVPNRHPSAALIGQLTARMKAERNRLLVISSSWRSKRIARQG
jgi:hypothetical protein